MSKITNTCSIIRVRNLKKEEHKYVECLKKQIILIQEIIDTSEQVPDNIKDHFNQIVQLYEEQSLPPSNSFQIMTIDFSNIPKIKQDGDRIPNGYAGFNWENIYFMSEQNAIDNHQLQGFRNAYTNSRKCVAYNGRGNPITMFLPNTQNSFSLHSFEAMSIYHDNFKLTITSYRSNVIFSVKNIILTNKKPTLFEINWEEIDKITFKPERILETGKPETFVLTSLNCIV